MSSALKMLLIAAFFALCAVLFALLPSTSQFPLPDAFTDSLELILAYTFAWAEIFTVLNTLLFCALIMIGFEAAIWLWKMVSWIIGFVSRLVA